MKEYYFFNKIKFKDGLLNNFVDATYIIHLENNGRMPNIEYQLKGYHPTNIVYLLINKGYKNFNKGPHISSPAYDLIDAYLQCFKHASKNNYNNILILEDDFIFSKKIKDINHILNINNFINKKNNSSFIYLLGCIPGVRLPVINNTNHYHLYLSIGNHAIIYSKKFRENVLNTDTLKIFDWDFFLNICNKNKFCYYLPLCYQLFPNTDNSRTWLNKNIILHFIGKNIFNILQMFKLNKQINPGYNFAYMFSKYILLIILLIIILLLIYLNIFRFIKSV